MEATYWDEYQRVLKGPMTWSRGGMGSRVGTLYISLKNRIRMIADGRTGVMRLVLSDQGDGQERGC